MRRGQAAAKSHVKTAKKAVAGAKSRARRAVKKVASHRRVTKPSLAKELGALAERLTTMGKTAFDQGTQKANKIARAGLLAIEHGSVKIGDEIAAIKRAALARMKH